MLEFLVSLAILIVVFALQIGFQDPLQDSSACLIETLQMSRNTVFDGFFVVFAVLSVGAFFAASGFIYLAGSRQVGAAGVLACAFGGALCATLKPLLGHPRPSWAYADVEAVMCSQDFGTPSGHAMSPGAGLLILGRFWLENKHWSKSLCICIVGLLLALDRLYLGMHFYFQVLLGFAFAQTIVAFLMTPQVKQFLERPSQNQRFLCVVLGMLLLLQLAALVQYAVYRPVFPEAWKQEFERKCSKHTSVEEAVLHSAGESTLYMFLCGFLYGMSRQRRTLLQHSCSELCWIAAAFVGAVLVFGGLDQGAIHLFPNLLGLVLGGVIKLVAGVFLSFLLPSLLHRRLRSFSYHSELEII